MINTKNLVLAAAVFVLAYVLYHGTSSRFVSDNMREFLGYDMNANYTYFVRGEHSPRHALSTIGTRYIVASLQKVFPLSVRDALVSTLAVIASLNAVLFLLLLLRITGNDRTASLLFTALFCICFANLTVFSVPETYAMTVLFILTYLILRHPSGIETASGSVFSSLFLGFASLNNAVLLALPVSRFSLAGPDPEKRANRVKQVAISLVLAAAAYYVLCVSLFGRGYTSFLPQLLHQYASFKYLVSLRLYANVFAGFIFYSVIAPVTALEQRIPLTGFLSYFQSPLAALLFIMYASFACYAIVSAVKHRDTYIDGMAAWLAVMFLLFVFFNPWEPIIFSSLVIPGILSIYAKTYLRITFRYKHLVFIVFLTLLAFKNISALQYPTDPGALPDRPAITQTR